MAMPKDVPEFEFWKEVFLIRSKYYGMKPDDDKAFKAMVDETRELSLKYEKTSTRIPAVWACLAIREIFNEEVKQIHWDNGIEK